MSPFYEVTPNSAAGLMCVRVMADYDRRMTIASPDAERDATENAVLGTIKIYIFCLSQVCYIA